MAAASSLSLLPSPLTFPPSERFSASSSSASSSSFFHGGTHLRFHQNFLSAHSYSFNSSPSSPNSQFNKRVSSRRRLGIVVSASGDYYATLGVPKSADSKEIKAAYRKLARQVRNLFIHLCVCLCNLVIVIKLEISCLRSLSVGK